MNTLNVLNDLYTKLVDTLSYRVFVATEDNIEQINSAIEETGCAIVISRTTARTTESVAPNASIRKLVLPILILTNPLVGGCPDYNTVLDNVERAIVGISIPPNNKHWVLGTATEYDDKPYNGFITIELEYNV